MNLTHNGKIGRLPEAVREEVNIRLRKGEKGRVLVAWLNSLPEVQAMLAAEFGGKPVREQNLSEWRKHGHQQWLLSQKAQGLMDRLGGDGQGRSEMNPRKLLDAMVTHVTARYVVTLEQMQREGTDRAAAWNQLRQSCRDVLALQRGELLAERLDLDWDKLAFGREKLRSGLIMRLMAERSPGGRPPGENTEFQAPSSNEGAGVEPAEVEDKEGEAPSVQHPSSNVQAAAGATVTGQQVRRVGEYVAQDEHEADLVIWVNPGESDRRIFYKKDELRPWTDGGGRQPGLMGSWNFQPGGRSHPSTFSQAMFQEFRPVERSVAPSESSTGCQGIPLDTLLASGSVRPEEVNWRRESRQHPAGAGLESQPCAGGEMLPTPTFENRIKRANYECGDLIGIPN